MASEGVATASAPATGGNEYALWIGWDSGEVLTITIDKHSRAFGPDVKHCQVLNNMIQGLVRATRAVTYHANNDRSVDAVFAMQPVEDIADAIMILSQLSAAICAEARA